MELRGPSLSVPHRPALPRGLGGYCLARSPANRWRVSLSKVWACSLDRGEKKRLCRRVAPPHSRCVSDLVSHRRLVGPETLNVSFYLLPFIFFGFPGSSSN